MSQPALPGEASDYLCNSGKDSAGNALPMPTAEQVSAIEPQMRIQSRAIVLLKHAHQCGQDTTRHADLLLRATQAIGCAPESDMSVKMAAIIRHDGETTKDMAFMFKQARKNNPEKLDQLCADIATVDPDPVDVTSASDAQDFGVRVTDFIITIGRIWNSKSQ